jgi:hypothetical protein
MRKSPKKEKIRGAPVQTHSLSFLFSGEKGKPYVFPVTL